MSDATRRRPPWLSGDCSASTLASPPPTRSASATSPASWFPTLNDAVDSELRGADLAVLERYGDPGRCLTPGTSASPSCCAPAHPPGCPRPRSSRGHGRGSASQRPPSTCTATTGRCPTPTSPPSWPPRPACRARCRPSRRPHRQARERAYLRVEPDELARTLPGIAEVGAPLLVAAIGRAQRFASAAKFKAFTGLTPKASETGETDRKGQAITKAGAARLRKQLLCSANPAGRSTRSSPRCTTPRWSSVAPTSRAELGRPSPRPILGPRPRNGQPLSDASRDVTPESPGRTTR
jgi:hypothetical protein